MIRFSETDHFGLPRSIEEVELNLGGLSFHVYPHQIHTLTEIVSAITVTDKASSSRIDDDGIRCDNRLPPNTNRLRLNKDPNKDEEMSLRLERLLQSEMMLKHGGAGARTVDPNVGG